MKKRLIKLAPIIFIFGVLPLSTYTTFVVTRCVPAGLIKKEVIKSDKPNSTPVEDWADEENPQKKQWLEIVYKSEQNAN